MRFGEAIKSALELRKWTQKTLASEAGLRYQWINRQIVGSRATQEPRQSHVAQLERALGGRFVHRGPNDWTFEPQGGGFGGETYVMDADEPVKGLADLMADSRLIAQYRITGEELEFLKTVRWSPMTRPTAQDYIGIVLAVRGRDARDGT